ncbi:hypothetical protein GOBAR_DD29585 [Gossypium barbadense]|nr:hypothetical protein GOBAR_DD29585 [Gossypium barbadense]
MRRIRRQKPPSSHLCIDCSGDFQPRPTLIATERTETSNGRVRTEARASGTVRRVKAWSLAVVWLGSEADDACKGSWGQGKAGGALVGCWRRLGFQKP